MRYVVGFLSVCALGVMPEAAERPARRHGRGRGNPRYQIRVGGTAENCTGWPSEPIIALPFVRGATETGFASLPSARLDVLHHHNPTEVDL